MGNKGFQCGVLLVAILTLSACVSSPKKMHASAPLPPQGTAFAMADFSPESFVNIQPAAGGDVDRRMVVSSAPQPSCSMSFTTSGPAIGYEISDRTHVGFDVSPKVNVFDPSDSEVRVGLNFKVALGMPSNKRPKCTHNGYYGMLPSAMNSDNSINLSRLTDMDTIKSYVDDRLQARERRQIERQKRLERGF